VELRWRCINVKSGDQVVSGVKVEFYGFLGGGPPELQVGST